MISQSHHTKRFCSEPLENIENYDKAVIDTQLWECHHRREIDDDGTKHSKEELISRGLYWHRPASELIFLRHDIHRSLHHKGNFNKSYCSHPVKMTRLADGFTKEFPSQSEAARWLRENGFPKACSIPIGRCCRGILKQNHGATWSFIE